MSIKKVFSSFSNKTCEYFINLHSKVVEKLPGVKLSLTDEIKYSPSIPLNNPFKYI